MSEDRPEPTQCVAAIDIGTCHTAAVIGTPKGDQPDPEVVFTVPNLYNKASVWPTLFTLRVPSNKAERWRTAEAFVEEHRRAFTQSAFFSPLPESVNKQKEQFSLLCATAEMTSDLNKAAAAYFKRQLAAKGPDADMDVTARVYGPGQSMSYANLQVSSVLLLGVFLGLVLQELTEETPSRWAPFTAIVLTIPDSFPGEAKNWYEAAYKLVCEARGWETRPVMYITTEAVAGAFGWSIQKLTDKMEAGFAEPIIRVDGGGMTAQAVLLRVAIMRHPETRAKELKGMSIMATVGDHSECAGMISGVIHRVVRLTQGCPVAARQWVDFRVYATEDRRVMARLIDDYLAGLLEYSGGEEEGTSLPGLTWSAFYKIIEDHFDSKLRLLRLLAQDDRVGVKAVLWTGNPHRGHLMRRVLRHLTEKVFPQVATIFEDQDQQLVASGAVVERLAETCVGYACSGVASGKIVKVEGVPDEMRDRLEIYLETQDANATRRVLEPVTLIGGGGTKVKRGDSNRVGLMGSKEDMLLTIQQVRLHSHITGCRTLIPREGRMDGDTLSALYLRRGVVFVYVWRRCSAEDSDGHKCNQEPRFRKGEVYTCAKHSTRSATRTGPRCDHLTTGPEGQLEECVRAARVRQGESGRSFCVECFQALQDEELDATPLMGLQFFGFNCATFYLDSAQRVARWDGVSNWIKNVASIVADEYDRQGKSAEAASLRKGELSAAAPLDELLEEALFCERETSATVGLSAQLLSKQQSLVPRVIRAIERLTCGKKRAAPKDSDKGDRGAPRDKPITRSTPRQMVLRSVPR